MTTSDGQGGDDGAGKNGSHEQAAGHADAPALAVIEAFGGIRPMAKTLGLAVSTVQGWKERAAIPANRHDQIRAAARDHKIALDPEVLRASAGEGGAGQPQTIEGVAEAAAADGGTAAKPAEHDDKDGKKDRPEDKQGAARSSAATAAGAGARRTEVPAAPARSRVGGAFVPGLIAGVVLAAVVAGATVFTQPYWGPLLTDEAGGVSSSALADVEAQLAELQAAIPADPRQALTAMSERVATLESALSQGAGQDPGTRAALESLSAELARMTDRIAALEQDLSSVRSMASTPSDAVTDRLASETQRLDSLLSQQSELAERIATAEQNLNAVQAAREDAPGSGETLLLLATLQLRDALQGSGPYADPLAMLQSLAEQDSDLGGLIAPLERHASTGLPTLRDLQASFPEVARRLAAIEASKGEDGWAAGVLRRLSEAVNLRPVGLVEGSTPTAVAARAEVKLNDGDLAGALTELDALEGAAAEAAASWRADAEARQAAEQAVSKLGALVSRRFAAMAGG